MTKKPETQVRVVILGAAAAGKKNFIRRYCTGIYSDIYDPLLEVSGDRRLANISGSLIAISLERIPSNILTYPTELERITTEADAVMLMYDGNDAQGIQEIQRVYEEFAKQLGVPRVVVVTKADAAGELWEENLRAGRALAEEIGARFCVSSALWGDGVKDTVEELVAEILGMAEHSNLGLVRSRTR